MSTDWLSVYRESLYALPRAGAEAVHFALDGPPKEADEGAALLGLQAAATWITGWNPDSVEQDVELNRAANRRLAAALQSAGVDYQPSYGASLPGTSPVWREEGYTVFGLDHASAVKWGTDFGQRALVQIDRAGAGLLFCADGSFHRCGVRLLSASELPPLGRADG